LSYKSWGASCIVFEGDGLADFRGDGYGAVAVGMHAVNEIFWMIRQSRVDVENVHTHVVRHLLDKGDYVLLEVGAA
jgi:hypothetical protein